MSKHLVKQLSKWFKQSKNDLTCGKLFTQLRNCLNWQNIV